MSKTSDAEIITLSSDSENEGDGMEETSRRDAGPPTVKTEKSDSNTNTSTTQTTNSKPVVLSAPPIPTPDNNRPGPSSSGIRRVVNGRSLSSTSSQSTILLSTATTGSRPGSSNSTASRLSNGSCSTDSDNLSQSQPKISLGDSNIIQNWGNKVDLLEASEKKAHTLLLRRDMELQEARNMIQVLQREIQENRIQAEDAEARETQLHEMKTASRRSTDEIAQLKLELAASRRARQDEVIRESNQKVAIAKFEKEVALQQSAYSELMDKYQKKDAECKKLKSFIQTSFRCLTDLNKDLSVEDDPTEGSNIISGDGFDFPSNPVTAENVLEDVEKLGRIWKQRMEASRREVKNLKAEVSNANKALMEVVELMGPMEISDQRLKPGRRGLRSAKDFSC